MKKVILDQYIKFVEFLGHILGPQYEIVLHDINDEDCSIIAIANGHVSERKVGAPLTDQGLQFIAEKVWKTCDYKANYTGMSNSNKILLSSSFFIKDNNDKLIGMFCVNVDTSVYKKMCDDFLKLVNMHSLSTTYVNSDNSSALPEFLENFSQSLVDVIQLVLNGFIGDDMTQVENLTQQEKMSIVDKLNQNGVFFLKGAVCEVAEQLKCSEASIYRYLSKINRNDKKVL